MVSIGIGTWIYQTQQQFTMINNICFLVGLIISIAELPLIIKISKMRQNTKQTADNTTDFTSIGKK